MGVIAVQSIIFSFIYQLKSHCNLDAILITCTCIISSYMVDTHGFHIKNLIFKASWKNVREKDFILFLCFWKPFLKKRIFKLKYSTFKM